MARLIVVSADAQKGRFLYIWLVAYFIMSVYLSWFHEDCLTILLLITECLVCSMGTFVCYIGICTSRGQAKCTTRAAQNLIIP